MEEDGKFDLLLDDRLGHPVGQPPRQPRQRLSVQPQDDEVRHEDDGDHDGPGDGREEPEHHKHACDGYPRGHHAAEDDDLAMQGDAAGHDGAEAKQRGQIEDVRADDDRLRRAAGGGPAR